ncbi:hypothetical protein ABW19_dt0206102 [Dactylella cylindrospora]|nr:hypothetical protein ABW19_dt0206102 [Dactylella cylindrospora]
MRDIKMEEDGEGWAAEPLNTDDVLELEMEIKRREEDINEVRRLMAEHEAEELLVPITPITPITPSKIGAEAIASIKIEADDDEDLDIDTDSSQTLRADDGAGVRRIIGGWPPYYNLEARPWGPMGSRNRKQ